MLKRTIKLAKTTYWEKFCGKLNAKANTGKIWKTIKHLKNDNPTSNFALVSKNGTLIDNHTIAGRFHVKSTQF